MSDVYVGFDTSKIGARHPTLSESQLGRSYQMRITEVVTGERGRVELRMFLPADAKGRRTGGKRLTVRKADAYRIASRLAAQYKVPRENVDVVAYQPPVEEDLTQGSDPGATD